MEGGLRCGERSRAGRCAAATPDANASAALRFGAAHGPVRAREAPSGPGQVGIIVLAPQAGLSLSAGAVGLDVAFSQRRPRSSSSLLRVHGGLAGPGQEQWDSEGRKGALPLRVGVRGRRPGPAEGGAEQEAERGGWGPGRSRAKGGWIKGAVGGTRSGSGGVGGTNGAGGLRLAAELRTPRQVPGLGGSAPGRAGDGSFLTLRPPGKALRFLRVFVCLSFPFAVEMKRGEEVPPYPTKALLSC